MGAVARIKQAWNAFLSTDPYQEPSYSEGVPTYGGARPDRTRLRYFNERSLIAAIFVRIAIDVSGIELRHVRLDATGRYEGDVDSDLNDALSISTNLDQPPRAFRQDMAMTLFDLGSIGIVPVDMTLDKNSGEIIDVQTIRVGQITAFRPQHVKVSIYNEARGVREERWLEKTKVAVVENPFYAVMNQSNSAYQRLVQKLGQLDTIDQKTATGKLDLIIQLPYTVKTEKRKAEAEARRGSIEEQLTGSTYGIAWADSTEKIVQLNRPIENNLLAQVERLTTMLYGQMGVTEGIMNGSASEAEMLNYFDRTVEPIIDAIAESMRRTFIGAKKDEKISYFRNPFKLVPLSQLADIVDKLGRNEVVSSNEIRGYLGIPPSTDPNADKLQNSNMPPKPEVGPVGPTSEGVPS